MAPTDEFETLLKEAVQAKRLSGSKITKLTELAMKSMEENTQLVSILYRTHKSLSSSAKISSLYVFDALCRAAKQQVTKKNLSSSASPSKGNAATFLVKVEGVLEGLFRDMIDTKNLEPKEKAKKVLDIWIKGSTFPSPILTRLGDIIEGKEPAVGLHDKPTQATADPRLAAQGATAPTLPPSSKMTSPTVTTNPQSALLALLAQAASNGANQGGSTPTPPPVTETAPPHQLDISHLNLLQQLAQTAKMVGSTALNPISVSNPVPPVASDINHGQTGFSRDEPFGSRMKDGQYDQYDSSDRRDYNSNHVGNPRGGSRGGRGRFRDRESRAPLQRTSRRSRSRSPTSRYGARRDIKPYSPPRRPSMSTLTTREQNIDEPHSSGPQIDEFGREIRTEQAEPQTVVAGVPSAKRDIPIDPRKPPANAAPASSSFSPPHPPAPIRNPPPQPPEKIAPTSQPSFPTSDNLPLGLEYFNLGTFDFTSPASWQTLGNMWQVTNGVAPSTEQLMQFVMTAGMTAGMAGMGSQPVGGQQWGQSGWGNDGNGYQQNSFGDGGGTAGYGFYDAGSQNEVNVATGPSFSDTAGPGFPPDPSGASGGRMQRVGDKWMFIREDAAVAS